MLPVDTKTITWLYDGIEIGTTTDTYVENLILPATSTPRTLLEGYIFGKGGEFRQIRIGDDVYLNNQKDNKNISIYSPVVFTDQDVYFDYVPKTDRPAQFTINYLDYDLTASHIQNSETGAEFYLDKTINYGDILIVWFLTIFGIFLIFKSAYNFFWKK